MVCLQLRKNLEIPRLYDLLQRLLGSGRARRRVVREFIRPEPGQRILDMGCGTAEVVEFLPSGVRYVGFDSHLAYVWSARKRSRCKARFFVASAGRALSETAGGGFHTVLALGLFHHLTDAQVRSLVNGAHAQLRAGGRLVTLDGVIHERQSLIARGLISLDRGSYVRHAEDYIALLRTRFSAVRTHLLTDLLRVPYSHFVAEARKE